MFTKLSAEISREEINSIISLKLDTAGLRAAYEALQKENAELKRNHKFTCENLADTVPFIEELEQKNAAQAKRIEELEAATDHLGLTPQQASDGLARYKAQVAEIESLRKQVEELSQPIPDWKIELLFNRAMDYRELRISEATYYKAVREILSASKNGE